MQHMKRKPYTPDAGIDLKQFMAEDFCLATRTRQLSRILTRTYEDALRAHGLTGTQFTLLTIITSREPITSAEIGRMLDFEKSTLSRTVGKMISKGWVEDQPGPTGERGLVTTPLGRKTLRNAIPAWQKVQQKTRAKFGDTAIKSLDKMVAAAQDM